MTEPDGNVQEPDPPRMDSPHTIITHSIGCCEQISFLLWANYIELTTNLSIKSEECSFDSYQSVFLKFLRISKKLN